MIGGTSPEELLRLVPFVTRVDRIEFARLIGSLEEMQVPAGTLIASEGDPADGMYLVEEGTVEISVRSGDRDVRLREVNAPGYFGDVGMLLGRHTASSRTVSDARIWRLPRQRYEQLVRDRPELGLAAAGAMAELVDRRERERAGAPTPAGEASRAADSRPVRRVPPWRIAGAAAGVALALALSRVSPPDGLSIAGWHASLVLLAAAIAWLFEPVPDFVVAIALAAAWITIGVAGPDLVFSGFATASWLLALGSLAIAAAMASSGVLYRIALLLLRRFPPTYGGQVASLLVGGTLMTPLVTLSVARVAAVAPVTRELARSMGYAARGPASAGLAFAGLAGYWYLSNVFLTGFATNFFVLELLPAAQRPDWLEWLRNALIAGVVCLAGAAAAVVLLFPAEHASRATATSLDRQRRALGPMSRSERVTVGALAVLIVGLAAEPLHGVPPAAVALAALVIAAAGVLGRDGFRTSLDWGFLLFIGILLGSGAVLAHTGVDTWIGETVIALTSGVRDTSLLVMLLAVGVIVARFILPSRPAMFLLALATIPVAPALGISPWVAGFVVLACANTWLLPYQGLEYLIARDAARGESFSDRQGIVFGAALTLVRLVAVAASIPYWRALGLIA